MVGHRPIVAPWGGAEARYSTNPYCTAVPATDKNPMFVLDMATSRVALGKVRVAYNAGKEVVEGALIDHNGLPTRNAAVMYEQPTGALQAFGEHKGYGLALLGEILGAALLGGPVTDPAQQGRETICNSMLTVIVDPKGFGRDIPFADAIDSMLAYVTSARPGEGVDKVRVPGEPERETGADRRANGVPVDPGTWALLVEAGVEAGMDRHDFDGIAG